MSTPQASAVTGPVGATALGLLLALAACGTPAAAPGEPAPAVAAPGEPAPAASAATTAGLARYAERRCDDDGLAFVQAHYGVQARPVAAHPTTVAAFAAWADRHGRGDARPPGEAAAGATLAVLCVYDGDFGQVPKGPPAGEPRATYTRLSAVTDAGAGWRLHAIGSRDALDAAAAPPPPPAGMVAPTGG